jgi:hypothetical protein
MKLTKGKGSPETGGCWMTAAAYYAENHWTDHPACVCPIITNLCIRLNDWCEDGEREKLIGPHLLTPVGTRDESLLKPRLVKLARFALDCAADALDLAGMKHGLREDFGDGDDLEKVRSAARAAHAATVDAYVPGEVVATTDATYAAYAAKAAKADYVAAYAAADAAFAAKAATVRATARATARAAQAAGATARATARAAQAAAYAAYAAYATKAAADATARAAAAVATGAYKGRLLDLILDLCAMSGPHEIVPAHTEDETLRVVCGVG